MGEAIYCEYAYEQAVKRNILANARKTFNKTYPRAQEVTDFLFKFLPEYGIYHSEKFLEQMAINLYRVYGKLSPKQYEAVCKSIDTAAERKEARMKAIEEQKARSEFLGVKNERKEFTAKIEKILEFEVPKFSYYDSSTMFMFLMRDEAGNRIVYKSKTPIRAQEGETIIFKATIKAHENYRGENQTIVQRVKIL